MSDSVPPPSSTLPSEKDLLKLIPMSDGQALAVRFRAAQIVYDKHDGKVKDLPDKQLEREIALESAFIVGTNLSFPGTPALMHQDSRVHVENLEKEYMELIKRRVTAPLYDEVPQKPLPPSAPLPDTPKHPDEIVQDTSFTPPTGRLAPKPMPTPRFDATNGRPLTRQT